MKGSNMKLLDFEDLPRKGIRFSSVHLWRLIRAGDFPKPVKIGNRNHWVEAEIDDFIAAKLAERDEVAA
jgi:prophage regulatory protein